MHALYKHLITTGRVVRHRPAIVLPGEPWWQLHAHLFVQHRLRRLEGSLTPPIRERKCLANDVQARVRLECLRVLLPPPDASDPMVTTVRHRDWVLGIPNHVPHLRWERHIWEGQVEEDRVISAGGVHQSLSNVMRGVAPKPIGLIETLAALRGVSHLASRLHPIVCCTTPRLHGIIGHISLEDSHVRAARRGLVVPLLVPRIPSYDLICRQRRGIYADSELCVRSCRRCEVCPPTRFVGRKHLHKRFALDRLHQFRDLGLEVALHGAMHTLVKKLYSLQRCPWQSEHYALGLDCVPGSNGPRDFRAWRRDRSNKFQTPRVFNRMRLRHTSELHVRSCAAPLNARVIVPQSLWKRLHAH
mmetsp:Transcript_82095/g.228837  ORF Transcript_82095/g.228837 Transcript_82095/m.228837 type:complete len:359 (-) Transcript_82095:1099-2175(-)